MSNVLIGIIGVILFIGLALAGALFLGPEFQRSTNNSRAAAITQGATQIANAVNLFNVQSGISATYDVGGALNPAVVTEGYLKSIPIPVVTGQLPYELADAAATNLVGGTAVTVITELGAANAEVCNAIEKQAGGDTASAAATTPSDRVAGCFNSGTAPTAFVRI